jgi:hypothetical protein
LFSSASSGSRMGFWTGDKATTVYGCVIGQLLRRMLEFVLG